MRTKLLTMLTFFGVLCANAQTTYNLNWFTGIGPNVDLTIETGDTVIWTWTNPNHTVENNPGNSVETFSSGFLGPVGSTFSHTFTVIGANDYLCSIHGTASMSGTITVTSNLGVDESELKIFNIVSNPATDMLVIELPQSINNGQLSIHDLQGKSIHSLPFNEKQSISINVSDFNVGLYLISIESGSQKQTQRFIKN
ncbi:putative secreted protein (Por secretion system target) [Gelidibacter algens]|uniref:Putative secreted protein (Por secretion system target) n=1 Tax=Gelidibacter algens TaxID=49280 RepID=A0A1A7R4R7_9FLAO|nr:T9SS type A sorting domain-containing protein [Gelidibacter algens]OBX27255.1 hypothetical protein A9996_00600 [Gelidibacter algens]RAJ22122.1 putative secreted protein (Por secretion system target) [Gelidibacter algens]